MKVSKRFQKIIDRNIEMKRLNKEHVVAGTPARKRSDAQAHNKKKAIV